MSSAQLPACQDAPERRQSVRLMPALTKIQLEAALLVAEDRLSNARIARKCGVTRRCIDKWKCRPEFQAEVSAHKAAWRKQTLEQGLADRAFRVRETQSDYDRLGLVIAERAKDPSMKEVPGGKTGLILRTVKSINAGEKETVIVQRGRPVTKIIKERRIVAEYETDNGLVMARAHLREQAARELGQWVEEVKRSGSVNV